MIGKTFVALCVGMTLGLGCVSGGVGSAQAGAKKKVFYIASYDQADVCGNPQEIGVMQGLTATGWTDGETLEMKRYFMDTKKTHTTAEAIQAQGKIALAQIAAFGPDVVVLVDDNAIREIGLPLTGRQNPAVVFSGMNGLPEAYEAKKAGFAASREKPGGNVTGVYEKLYVVQSIKVMKNAIPALKKIVAIVDDTATGSAIAKQFEIELKEKPADITWETKKVANWNEYTKLIAMVNENPEVGAIYPAALSLKVSDNLTYTAAEILKWTTENNHKPEMALNYFFSKIGLFGGAAVDFMSMGALAGKKAGQILNGAKAGDLAIEDAPDYAIVFNLKRARQLGITIPAPLLTAANQVYKEE